MQPPSVLCLPNFLIASSCSLWFIIRYKVRFAFRGEKPIRNQSTSLPLVGLLYLLCPKPIRAATALIETPVAIASGLSHYLKLGIDVYETPWAVILTNFLFSVVMVFLVDKFFKRRKQKSALK